MAGPIAPIVTTASGIWTHPTRTSPSADGAGANESLFQSIACAALPSLCDATGCGVGGLGCPSYRNEAVRLLITITDEENQCDTAPSCSPTTAAEVGAVLRGSSLLFAGINAGTAAVTTEDLTGVARESGSFASDGAPLVFQAGDAGSPEGAMRLVDAVVKPAQFGAAVQERARKLAETSDRPAGAKGVTLPRIERTVSDDGVRYEHVNVQLDRARRTATLTVKAPAELKALIVTQIQFLLNPRIGKSRRGELVKPGLTA